MSQIFRISIFPDMWQPIYECLVSCKINSYIPCNFPLMYTHSLFTVFLLLSSIFKQSPSDADGMQQNLMHFPPSILLLLQLILLYSMDPCIKRYFIKNFVPKALWYFVKLTIIVFWFLNNMIFMHCMICRLLFSSVQFSHSVMSNSLQAHGLQHARFPCPSPNTGVIQIYVHWVSDAIQTSHPPSSPSPPTLNLSQHQGVLQWVSSSHRVAKVLELQLQH